LVLINHIIVVKNVIKMAKEEETSYENITAEQERQAKEKAIKEMRESTAYPSMLYAMGGQDFENDKTKAKFKKDYKNSLIGMASKFERTDPHFARNATVFASDKKVEIEDVNKYLEKTLRAVDNVWYGAQGLGIEYYAPKEEGFNGSLSNLIAVTSARNAGKALSDEAKDAVDTFENILNRPAYDASSKAARKDAVNFLTEGASPKLQQLLRFGYNCMSDKTVELELALRETIVVDETGKLPGVIGTLGEVVSDVLTKRPKSDKQAGTVISYVGQRQLTGEKIARTKKKFVEAEGEPYEFAKRAFSSEK
jgi:hypothetical protein